MPEWREGAGGRAINREAGMPKASGGVFLSSPIQRCTAGMGGGGEVNLKTRGNMRKEEKGKGGERVVEGVVIMTGG